MTIDKVIQTRRGFEVARPLDLLAPGQLGVTIDTDHKGQRVFVGDGATLGGLLVNRTMQPHPGNRTGFHYSSAVINSVPNTGVGTAGFVQYQPVYIGGDEKTLTGIQSLHINVVAGTGGATAEFGLYTNGLGKPLTRLTTSGAISIASAGFKTFAVVLSIPSGWYWFGFVTNSGVPTFTRCNSAFGTSGLMGSNTAAVAFTNTFADIAGTLPATATAAFAASASVPIVWLKR